MNPLVYLASYDDLAQIAVDSKPAEYVIPGINDPNILLMHWLQHWGNLHYVNHGQYEIAQGLREKPDFDPWCYIAGYPETKYMFWQNNTLNEDMACFAWIVYGRIYGLNKNNKQLKIPKMYLKEKKRVLLFQTCDGISKYSILMKKTNQINSYYCNKLGYDVKTYEGVKRGVHSWYASFNRHYCIPEIIMTQQYDWIMYLDADAYINDFSQTLEDFIEPYKEKALIVSRGGSDTIPWDFNNGVMLINASHPKSLEIFEFCAKKFNDYSDSYLQKYKKPWSAPGVDDQHFMHLFFQSNKKNLDCLHVFRNNEANKINYCNGEYIAQIIRPEKNNLNLDERIRIIENKINSINN